jgi:tRNA threonylcarbamoyl adenosine modification protein YjeE
MFSSFFAQTEADLHALGLKIGQFLQGGENIALIGNLGAGKTTLAKAVLQGAGVKMKGFSPTFVLDAAYAVKKGALREIHHLDLYRLKDETELITLGITELLERDDTTLLVEWADRFTFLPKNNFLEIIITNKEEGRLLTFKPHGARYETLTKNILTDR